MNKLKKFDSKFYDESIIRIAGIDEAGRGPLAGPVVAAAVIFDRNKFIEGVNDSKKISEKLREELSFKIKENAFDYSYGIIDQNTIDEINILQSTLKAMSIAANGLKNYPDLILIDGNKSFVSKITTKTIIRGDSLSFSIAAASILAKVKRDKIMKELSTIYPQYGWERNKGYGTKEHIKAIKEFGLTEHHRKSFLRKILYNEVQEKII